MRVLGALMFLLGAAGAGLALRASFQRTRGVAALFGLAAPFALLLAIAGLVLVFVPGFFG